MADFKNIYDNPHPPIYSSNASTLVGEVSSTEYYIGISNGGDKDESAAFWNIKKIWKDGNVWRTQFPDGDQSFKFVWNSRGTYTYK